VEVEEQSVLGLSQEAEVVQRDCSARVIFRIQRWREQLGSFRWVKAVPIRLLPHPGRDEEEVGPVRAAISVLHPAEQGVREGQEGIQLSTMAVVAD